MAGVWLINGTFHGSVSCQKFYAARHSMVLDDEQFFPANGIFTYPNHPFDPDLCDIIAKFRPGLTEIALTGLLSHQIMNLIARINTWDQDISTSLRDFDLHSLNELSHSARNVTLCGEFLHRKPALSLIEQLVVLALMAFCYSTDSTRAMFYLTNAYLQIRCRYLRYLSIDITERNEVLMTWIGTMLVATFDPAAQPCLLGLSLLRAQPNPKSWQENVKICETYFWNDGLSLKLAAKIAHIRAVERQGHGSGSGSSVEN